MKLISYIRGLLLIIGLIIGMTMQSCKDDFVIEDDPSNPGEVKIEGDCLGFIMELEKDPTTRADGHGLGFSSMTSSQVEKFDNYIDTQDKFRIFFFTENGDFLFGATDRVVGSLSNTTAADYWYVRIPMTMIVDRDNQEYDINKIKDYLKTHHFKIAVLANWPNAGAKINPADWDDSESTQSSNENPSSVLKGHPLWNWSNSILNEKANPSDIRNINDLHHLYNDIYYGDAAMTTAGTTRKGVFQDYMAEVTSGDDPGWYMGEPTDWVKMRTVNETGGWRYPNGEAMVDVNGNGGFESKEEANKWIRANWSPNIELNQNKKIYRHYQHMWFLWNFHASYVTGAKNNNITYKKDSKGNLETNDEGYYIPEAIEDVSEYDDNWEWNNGVKGIANPWGAEWYKRNGEILYRWMKASFDEKKAIGSKVINVGESNNGVFFSYTALTGSPAYCVKVSDSKGKDNYGILLPNLGDGPKGNNNGMIQFHARTTGTLRIKWGSEDGNTAKLAVQIGLRGQTDTRDEDIIYNTHTLSSTQDPSDWENETDENLPFYDITVSDNAMPIYIFCASGKAVVYSIEYIRGKYLYETDREGVSPNEHQGIPMYGVKDFDPIPDWQRGTTHNLEGNISLIRALAKVEVYIKSDFGEPRHVLMRGMNRAARCEPMDVHTPTDEIWKDNHYTDDPNELCEWYRIFHHGPNYKISNYQDWLSWFYGSWKMPGTHWKISGGGVPYKWDYDKGFYVPNGTQGGWNKGNFDYKNDADGYSPPRIFNPYLYKCDFCRFIYVDETKPSSEEGLAVADNVTYYRYVLYVPEKNIDDPSIVGSTGSNPRVPHIEYRFNPPAVTDAVDGEMGVDNELTNTEYNLDDNDCYRIYFTNYGYDSNSANDGSIYGIPINNELKNGRWRQATYDAYEKDHERLKKHWPIMRNHVYQFYVGGDGPANPTIHVKVSDWSHRKVVVEW